MRGSEQSSTSRLLCDTLYFIDLHYILCWSSLFSRKGPFDLIVLWMKTIPYLRSSLSAFLEPFLSLFYPFWANQKSRQQSNCRYIIDLFRDADIFKVILHLFHSFLLSKISYHAVFFCDCYQVLIQCFHIMSAFDFPFAFPVSGVYHIFMSHVSEHLILHKVSAAFLLNSCKFCAVPGRFSRWSSHLAMCHSWGLQKTPWEGVGTGPPGFDQQCGNPGVNAS